MKRLFLFSTLIAAIAVSGVVIAAGGRGGGGGRPGGGGGGGRPPGGGGLTAPAHGGGGGAHPGGAGHPGGPGQPAGGPRPGGQGHPGGAGPGSFGPGGAGTAQRPNTNNRPGNLGPGNAGPANGPANNKRPGNVGPGNQNPIARQGGVGSGNINPNTIQNRAGTYHQPYSDLAQQADGIRGAYNGYGNFTPEWHAQYPGAWAAAGWGAATAWTGASYASLASMYSYPAQPMYYDYGTSAVNQGGSMYVNGDNVGSAANYAQQASTFVDTGREAKVSDDEQWTSLGVFALATEQETSPSNVFQLAINKSGVIRGSYYNSLTDSAQTVYGSVDAKSQRAAWSIADQKFPVYEAGIANLTKNETTMLAHYENGQSSQFTLVRLEQPEQGDGK